MSISNKREFQHISKNHSSDIDFKDLMNLHKNISTKPNPVLVNDANLAWDNHLRFRRNLLEKKSKVIITIMIRLETKNHSTILMEKQQKY